MYKLALRRKNTAFIGNIMKNKLYTSNDLRFLFKSLDQEEQTQSKVKGGN